MGHYDSSYASDDYRELSKKGKSELHKSFRAELKEQGCVWGTYDDVHGIALAHWAEEKGYRIEGTHTFLVYKK